MKMLIVGGRGAFGSYYAKVFTRYGFKVSILGTNLTKTREFCEENNYGFVDNASTPEKVKDFAVIVVSVPNEVAPGVVKQLGKVIAKGTLLMDFCSVKTFVVKELLKLKGKDIEIASVHPMHGPRVKSIEGLPVIFVPIKCGEKVDIMRRLFEEEKANITELSAEEHDKLLSVVQGLVHFSEFVSAVTIKELETNMRKATSLGSPNFELFLSAMGRVILQNPEMYAQIQANNPYNKRMRETFIQKAKELSGVIDDEGSGGLEREINDAAKIFDAPEEVLNKSDAAVNAFKEYNRQAKKSKKS